MKKSNNLTISPISGKLAHKYTCYGCKNEFYSELGKHVYLLRVKEKYTKQQIFCCYNCRAKFIKEHPDKLGNSIIYKGVKVDEKYW